MTWTADEVAREILEATVRTGAGGVIMVDLSAAFPEIYGEGPCWLRWEWYQEGSVPPNSREATHGKE